MTEPDTAPPPSDRLALALDSAIRKVVPAHLLQGVPTSRPGGGPVPAYMTYQPVPLCKTSELIAFMSGDHFEDAILAAPRVPPENGSSSGPQEQPTSKHQAQAATPHSNAAAVAVPALASSPAAAQHGAASSSAALAGAEHSTPANTPATAAAVSSTAEGAGPQHANVPAAAPEAAADTRAHAPAAAGGGAARIAAAASCTVAATQPQLAADSDPDNDPNSPFYTLHGPTQAQVEAVLAKLVRDKLSAIKWDGLYLIIPPAPYTKAQWIELRIQIQQLDDRTYEAVPWLCQLVLSGLWLPSHGAGHPETIWALCRVIDLMREQNEYCTQLYEFLIPRAARLWGLKHEYTGQLARVAAQALCSTGGPGAYPGITRALTQLVMHIPGVLGWPRARVSPLDDQHAFHRRAEMQARAAALLQQGKAAAARPLFEQCSEYYGLLGSHWLSRPANYMCCLAVATWCREVNQVESEQELALLCAWFVRTRRFLHGQLGTYHKVAIWYTWAYAEQLYNRGQYSQAHSMYNTALQRAQDALGRRHVMALDIQVSTHTQTYTRTTHTHTHTHTHGTGMTTNTRTSLLCCRSLTQLASSDACAACAHSTSVCVCMCVCVCVSCAGCIGALPAQGGPWRGSSGDVSLSV